MVRIRVVLNSLGKIILIVGIAMLSSVICSIYYSEGVAGTTLIAAMITMAVGLSLSWLFRNDGSLNYREGFAIVPLSWIVASLFGSLPYLLSGCFPSFADALFETVSGFSTTGATILLDVESLPMGLLFWRSLTQWLGGMGIVVLFVAVIVGMGARANQVFKAELPGPLPDKLSPRIRETAKILWMTYLSLSLLLLLLLYLFGMDLFDAFCHTFSTMATGGFSTKNSSMSLYSPALQWIIAVFMFLGGTNLSLHYFAFHKRNIMEYLRNPEFRLYCWFSFIALFLVFIGLSTIPSVEERIRVSIFQVISIITTTGYTTSDYSLWPVSSQSIVFILMLIGGCAGSTSGNIKVGRYLIMLQRAKLEIQQMIHPRALMTLRFGNKVLGDGLIINVLQFFFIYIILILTGTIAMGFLGLDLISALSSVVASIGNVGPAFGLLGPTQNYAFVPDSGKYLLCAFMLLGRLEIYPFLILFSSSYWKD